MEYIRIFGAKTHNLANLSCVVPKNKLVVLTGVSGSGKSSLAFDTLYAEGQRRYVASLSTYARQFLSVMAPPDVERIEGLAPAIAIQQKTGSANPRSTVGTITEIYDHLRVLFARVGTPYCPTHHRALYSATIAEIVDVLLQKSGVWMILAPLPTISPSEWSKQLNQLRLQGFSRIIADQTVVDLNQPLHYLSGPLKLVIDRVSPSATVRERLSESISFAVSKSGGRVLAVPYTHPEKITALDEQLEFSTEFACARCGYQIAPLEPNQFSFNSPQGACAACGGLGEKPFVDVKKVVKHPHLSLRCGAIPYWDTTHQKRWATMEQLSEEFSFDLEAPFDSLPDAIKQLLLYGDQTQSSGFEGIVNHITRRQQETHLHYVQERLATYSSTQPCPVCQGQRIGRVAQTVFLGGKNIAQVAACSIEACATWLDQLQLNAQQTRIAEKLLREIKSRLNFLLEVGLPYLTLNRSADTLSGGEAQRIRLASQIGAGLTGVLYVLDEPSIGLHPRDNEQLIASLKALRDLGNHVVVVEHDEETLLNADYLIEIGPGPGKHGGQLVAAGPPESIKANTHSVTGAYLSGRMCVYQPSHQKAFNPKAVIELVEATGHNLKKLSIRIPLGLFTCVTGVSGSGKSTLISDTLQRIAHNTLNKGDGPKPEAYHAIHGLEACDKLVHIDQSPIGRTPRSNPATYTGVFTPIRELFAQVPEAKVRGYQPSRFSFNLKGGRCAHCEGDGMLRIEMHFLPDVYVHCDRCQGKRYNQETCEILYRGKSIHDVLSMSVEEAAEFFSALPSIAKILNTLMETGLSYITLGQPATTLSGGEAQRIKLAKSLAKKSTGKTLYILDEPTTGLHFSDVQNLLHSLFKLRDQGNTIIVIEHNLDVISCADWIIDLGPEGGDAGGEVIYEGTPDAMIVQPTQTQTAKYLALHRRLHPVA